jgi:hypothetical protein
MLQPDQVVAPEAILVQTPPPAKTADLVGKAAGSDEAALDEADRGSSSGSTGGLEMLGASGGQQAGKGAEFVAAQLRQGLMVRSCAVATATAGLQHMLCRYLRSLVPSLCWLLAREVSRVTLERCTPCCAGALPGFL